MISFETAQSTFTCPAVPTVTEFVAHLPRRASRWAMLRASIRWQRSRRGIKAELDYDEMLALAGLCRQWAIGKNKFKPEQRTQLIALSADFEELAQWAGEGWRASDPSNEASMLRFFARRVLHNSSVIKLEHAKHWLRMT